MKIVSALVLTALFSLVIKAQTSQPNVLTEEKCQKDTDVRISEYPVKNWKLIELRQFSFYIPQSLSKQNSRCWDGPCYEFEDDSRLIGVDINSGAVGPSFQTGFPSYEEHGLCIGGRMAWIFHFKASENSTSEYNYVSGVLFKYDKHRNMVVTLLSKNAPEKQTAENIFRSIRFKK